MVLVPRHPAPPASALLECTTGLYAVPFMSNASSRTAGVIGYLLEQPTPGAGSWVPTSLRRHPKANLVVAAALIGLVIRLATLIAAGHLTGSWEYDDAVYFGSAIRLVHGAIPYRDFVLIQPPGVPLLLAPIALLSYPLGTHDALEIARLAVLVVSFANVLLLGRLLRHRSPLVIAVACLGLALYPDAILASSALLLEPFLNLFCLIGLVLIFERDRLSDLQSRVFWSGVAFGMAGTMKSWAILPVAILFLMLIGRRPLRAVSFVLGNAAGLLVLCLPFLLMAPVAFIHQVAVDQLSRTGQAGLPLIDRLEFMTSVWPGLGVPGGHLYKLLAVGSALAIVIVVGAAFLWRWNAAPQATQSARLPRLRPSTLEAFAIVSVLVIGVALSWPPDFFYHYAAFLAPFLALLLGLSVSRLAFFWPKQVMALTAIVCLLAGLHALAIPVLLQRAADPSSAIAAVIPAGSCVVTDDSEFTLNANRFVSSSPSCPAMVDALGTTISISSSQDPASPPAQAAAPVWLGMFERADYLVLTPLSYLRIPWNLSLEAYIQAHFAPVPDSPVLVLQRVPPGSPHPPFALPSLPVSG